MKYRLRIAIVCLMSLLLAASILPARAETTRAEDLTGRCSFDFGSYKNAESRVFSEISRYQIFQPNDSFSLTWKETLEGARLCLVWQTAPHNVSILQFDADGTLLRTDVIDRFHETATPLLPNARKAVVQAGESDMQVRFCAVYGEGELPEAFHAWKETPDHLDYLLISTHPDDDVLFLGSIPPTCAEQGYVGTVVYVTTMTDAEKGRIRISEAENGAWEMGIRSYPLFLGMPDVADSSSQEKKKLFRYDDLLVNLVRVYRSVRPLVVFAQDTEGEYGHWQHVLVSKASREAFALAADPTFDPESCEQYGTWQVQKLFLHLYPENTITVDAHAPLSFFDGRNAFEVACGAYLKHESQQGMWFYVQQDDEKYAFNRFGMAEGAVPVGDDVFDNIDETLFYGYTPPPTPEPTPEPTAESTPEPTPEPTAVPTPEPTPTPAEPRKADRALPFVLAAAGVVLIAIVILLIVKRKRRAN